MLNWLTKTVVNTKTFAVLFFATFALALSGLELFNHLNNDLGVIVVSLVWFTVTLSLILFRSQAINNKY